MSKPWIVYKRAAAVLFFVSRFADEERARTRAKEEGGFCKNIGEMSDETRSALGLGKIVKESCCPDPQIRGGRCTNCDTWIESGSNLAQGDNEG